MNRVIVAVVLFGMLLLYACQPKTTKEKAEATPVNVYTVQNSEVYYYDKYPSTVQALSQVNIVSNVQGYVTAISVPDGSKVRKGQVLYKIDERIYQAAYDQAQANLRVVKGSELQAKQDADRYVYLNSYHAVAKQLYDHAVIALDNAKNATKAAEEAVRTARTNLNFATIYAPFDGTIGFSQVRLGNVANAGQTVLNTISTNDPMAVDFIVNEKQLSLFEAIKSGRTAMPDSLFTLLLPDNTLYSGMGKISVIDRAVDPQTGSVKVRLVFPNPKNELKVGMSCVVRVHNQDNGPQMVIPGKAVVEQMGEYFVYIAKDTVMNSGAVNGSAKKAQTEASANDHASKLHAIQRKIKLGQTIGAEVIVLSGINDGDKVIVDGIQSIHDGSVISLTDKGASSNEKGKQEK